MRLKMALVFELLTGEQFLKELFTVMPSTPHEEMAERSFDISKCS
jgi:hypothetical protein